MKNHFIFNYAMMAISAITAISVALANDIEPGIKVITSLLTLIAIILLQIELKVSQTANKRGPYHNGLSE